MGKRPQIPQTKSSTYRPMTQMNGDFLTQLKKPVCSEFNPDFRGSTRAREAHCRQQVQLWYKDQEYTLRKINRREDELYDDLIQVEKEKRKLRKGKLRKRSMSNDSLSTKSDIPTLPTLDNPNGNSVPEKGVEIDSHDNEIRHPKTDLPSVIDGHNDTFASLKLGGQHKTADPNTTTSQHGACTTSSKELDAFLPVIDENGMLRDVASEAIDVVDKTNDLHSTVYDDDTNQILPHALQTYYEVTPEIDFAERSQSVGYVDFQNYAEGIDRELMDRPHSSERYKKKRQSVGLILINRNRGKETEQRRRTILNNERLQLYDRNEKGEVVPSYRHFKRKAFTLPTAKEMRERKKLLNELKDKKDTETKQIQQFFVKVDEDKGKALQRFQARRQKSSDELVLKEKSSPGMVSLERLATIFSHRNVNPLPENVDPESIEAMRQMTYVRGYTEDSEDSSLQRQKARNQSKHIFQQKFKLLI